MPIFPFCRRRVTVSAAPAPDTCPPHTPYRHIPTHAATDALAGAPRSANTRATDRSRIAAYNRRLSSSSSSVNSSRSSSSSAGISSKTTSNVLALPTSASASRSLLQGLRGQGRGVGVDVTGYKGSRPRTMPASQYNPSSLSSALAAKANRSNNRLSIPSYTTSHISHGNQADRLRMLKQGHENRPPSRLHHHHHHNCNHSCAAVSQCNMLIRRSWHERMGEVLYAD